MQAGGAGDSSGLALVQSHAHSYEQRRGKKGERSTVAWPDMTTPPATSSDFLRKGDRFSDISKSALGQGTAEARAITFPTLQHRTSLGQPSRNSPSSALDIASDHAPSVCES